MARGIKINLKGGNMYNIRTYRKSDESSWLKCRLLSFYQTSYEKDVQREKESYQNPAIELVAEINGKIVGLVSIECYVNQLTKEKSQGAIMWHLAVLPDYQKLGIGSALWEVAKEKLAEKSVSYCELWTQEDEEANRFYRRMGFSQDKSQTYLRGYLKPLVREIDLGDGTRSTYFVEEMLIQAPIEDREKLVANGVKVNEVRLYGQYLD